MNCRETSHTDRVLGWLCLCWAIQFRAHGTCHQTEELVRLSELRPGETQRLEIGRSWATPYLFLYLLCNMYPQYPTERTTNSHVWNHLELVLSHGDRASLTSFPLCSFRHIGENTAIPLHTQDSTEWLTHVVASGGHCGTLPPLRSILTIHDWNLLAAYGLA